MKLFEKVIKDAISDQKYKSGQREVSKTIKNSKLIIVSKSLSPNYSKDLKDQAKSHNVPIIDFDGNSIDLGKACGKSYRISVLSLKSISDNDLSSLLSEYNKNQ